MQRLEIASMERGKVAGGFGLGVGIAAGLVVAGLVLRQLGINGNGTMGLRARRMAGGVTVRARIMGARIAGMGNDVTKAPGQVLTAAVQWSNATTNFRNEPIAWPFRLQLTATNPVGPVTFDSVFFGVTAGLNEQRTDNLVTTVPTGAATGNYNVHIVLQAKRSQTDGTPMPGTADSDWIGVAITLAGVMTIPAEAGPAIPAGSVGSITLSQRWAKAQLMNRGFRRRP